MRRRILLLVVGMTTLVVLAFAIPMAFLIRAQAAQKADDDTKTQATSTVNFLRGAPSTSQLTAYVTRLNSSTVRSMSVEELASRTVIGRTPADSAPLPRFPAGLGNGLPGQGQPSGPTSLRPGGGDVLGGAGTGGADEGRVSVQLQPAPGGQVAVAFARSVDASDPQTYLVRVYLPDSQRYDGATTLYLLLGGAAAALIVVGIVAGEVLTRRVVRPLVQTATTAQALSAGDTTARAPTDGPGEIADVGRALNRLADRIDELIAEERETVADLSHRLRTPLTALRLDAEALESPADAERIGTHVSTLERMLTAVIHLARRPQREGRMPSCDATAVVADRVAFWSALTEEQGRVATVSLPAHPLPVRAAEEDLAAAVDALLENVVAHTPEGTAFTVRLVATEPGARLEVADDGPGLDLDEPVRGRSDRGSTGLGLDIARRCAQASGGSLTLGRSPSGGALITVDLGRP